MSENMRIWDAVCRPPESALKTIGGGRLRGMTDINPMWRIEELTKQFGLCGVGWYYTIDELWTTPGAGEEVIANARISLYIKIDGEWSEAIPGVGGAMLVALEKGGLHSNDEAHKMDVTDAISVACKALGFGADIHYGRWDGSKYTDAVPKEKSAALAGWLDDVERLKGKTPTECEKWWTDNKVACKKDLGTALASDVHHAMLAIQEAAKEAGDGS